MAKFFKNGIICVLEGKWYNNVANIVKTSNTKILNLLYNGLKLPDEVTKAIMGANISKTITSNITNLKKKSGINLILILFFKPFTVGEKLNILLMPAVKKIKTTNNV